jgi:hypothetical protein
MRLIDADALKKKATMRANCISPMVTEYRMCVITRDIDDAPTIEAEPVKHGRWEVFLSDYDDCEMMSCSNCRSEFYDGDNDTVDNFPNYCANCGAKMDLE